MKIPEASFEEISSFLASRIRSERIRQGLTQASMAKSAGIPLRTYKRIELTGSGTILNLLIILKALGRIRAVEVLFPAPPSPRLTVVDRAKIIEEKSKLKKQQNE